LAGIRKLYLIVSHADLVNIISELIDLECVEPIEPEVTFEPPELASFVKREVMELDSYDANKESISLLMTQYTYILAGWMPAEFESELASVLSGFTCAWSYDDPLPNESDDLPVYIKYPQVFGKLRSGGRKVFEPLGKKRLV